MHGMSQESPRQGLRLAAIVSVVVVGSLIAVSCSSSSRSKATSASGASPALAAHNKFTVGLVSTGMGSLLADSSGRTLYSFSADHGAPACTTASCVAEWPPLLIAAGTQPVAGPGLTGKLATVARSNGQRQVTYNELPLYTFAGDTASGQTGGEHLTTAIGGMKGVWSVVRVTSKFVAAASPATTKAHSAAPSTSPATTSAPAMTQPQSTQPPTTQAPATTRPPVTSPPTTKAPPTTQPPPTTSPPTTAYNWA